MSIIVTIVIAPLLRILEFANNRSADGIKIMLTIVFLSSYVSYVTFAGVTTLSPMCVRQPRWRWSR